MDICRTACFKLNPTPAQVEVLDRYIQTMLAQSGRRIEVINEAENDKDELMQDLIAIITSFVARYYGRRRAKRKTEKIIEALSQDD